MNLSGILEKEIYLKVIYLFYWSFRVVYGSYIYLIVKFGIVWY